MSQLKSILAKAGSGDSPSCAHFVGHHVDCFRQRCIRPQERDEAESDGQGNNRPPENSEQTKNNGNCRETPRNAPLKPEQSSANNSKQRSENRSQHISSNRLPQKRLAAPHPEGLGELGG